MPFQFPPRAWPAASMLAAGLMLTMAGCAGQITPLGPGVPPAPHRLRTPIVLQAVRVQPRTPAGGCPAGFAVLPGGPRQCYRKLGTPVRFASAAISVSTISAAQPATAAPGPAPTPVSYGFLIALPSSDTAALTTVSTAAADAHGSLAISVAGRTWALPGVWRPFTSPQFQVTLPTKQAREFRRLVAPSS